jgi:hypothetical protein
MTDILTSHRTLPEAANSASKPQQFKQINVKLANGRKGVGNLSIMSHLGQQIACS